MVLEGCQYRGALLQCIRFGGAVFCVLALAGCGDDANDTTGSGSALEDVAVAAADVAASQDVAVEDTAAEDTASPQDTGNAGDTRTPPSDVDSPADGDDDTGVPAPSDTSSPADARGPQELPECKPGAGVGDVHKNLAYATVHERNKLDLYLPLDKGPVPVLIWVHGGGWKGGNKDALPPMVSPFVKQGYAIASVGYRLSDHAWPAQIADVKAAVRWLRLNAESYGLDKDRFGAWGASAGGHLVAMLGVTSGVDALNDPALGNTNVSDAVQAVIDYYGPSELLTMDEDAKTAGCPANGLCHTCAGSPEELLIDCPSGLSACPEKAAQASPITHVDATDAPFIVVHGLKDCSVPTPQGARMHQALVDAGVESQLFEVPNAGHSKPEVSTPQVMTAVTTFLDEKLRGCKTVIGTGGTAPNQPQYATVDECQTAECPNKLAACQALEGCMGVEECFRKCLKNKAGSCVQKCAGKLSPEQFETHKALFMCAKQAKCYELL